MHNLLDDLFEEYQDTLDLNDILDQMDADEYYEFIHNILTDIQSSNIDIGDETCDDSLSHLGLNLEI